MSRFIGRTKEYVRAQVNLNSALLFPRKACLSSVTMVQMTGHPECFIKIKKTEKEIEAEKDERVAEPPADVRFISPL